MKELIEKKSRKAGHRVSMSTTNLGKDIEKTADRLKEAASEASSVISNMSLRARSKWKVPDKEASALETKINSAIKTLKDANQTLRDWAENVDQRSK